MEELVTLSQLKMTSGLLSDEKLFSSSVWRTCPGDRSGRGHRWAHGSNAIPRSYRSPKFSRRFVSSHVSE
jgi:hypothetical protein